jgi:hypothetical protein
MKGEGEGERKGEGSKGESSLSLFLFSRLKGELHITLSLSPSLCSLLYMNVSTVCTKRGECKGLFSLCILHIPHTQPTADAINTNERRYLPYSAILFLRKQTEREREIEIERGK